MPVAYLDLPSGLGADLRKNLVKEVAEFIHQAYMIPDTRVFLREWPAEQIGIDGELGRSMRSICNLVVPPELPVEAKRQLVNRISAAIAQACNLPPENIPLPSDQKASTRWALGFFSEYPLDQAFLDDLMAFEDLGHSSKPTLAISPSRWP